MANTECSMDSRKATLGPQRHCAFSVRDGRVWVEDLGSRHGTCLNGQPVEGLRPLHGGDRLDLAYVPFEVRLSGRSGKARI